MEQPIYKDPKDLRELTAERLNFEGNQHGHQMSTWSDLFNIEVAIKNKSLSELEKWCILSNRYLLMEREHLSEYKLFNKEEVIAMINAAYNQGWQDGYYSNEDSTTQVEGERKYMERVSSI